MEIVILGFRVWGLGILPPNNGESNGKSHGERHGNWDDVGVLYLGS